MKSIFCLKDKKSSKKFFFLTINFSLLTSFLPVTSSAVLLEAADGGDTLMLGIAAPRNGTAVKEKCQKQIWIFFSSWGQSYETFYGHNLQIFIIT